MASLEHRLLSSTLAVSAAVYLVSGAGFYALLRQSAYQDMHKSLNTQLELMKGLLEEQADGSIELELNEVRSGNYVQKFSGRYFLVLAPGQAPILSGSLAGRMPPYVAGLFRDAAPHFNEATGPRGEPLLVLSEIVPFDGKELRLLAAESMVATRGWLTRVLVVLGVGVPTALLALLGVLALTVKLGLRPLHRLIAELEGFDVQRQTALSAPPADQARELRELAGAFNRLLNRISSLRQAEAQLLQDVSHQMKTPVTVILSTCDVMLQRLRAPEMYQDALEQIRQTGANMRQLLNRLLSVAHLDAENRHTLQLRRLDLSALVTRTLEMLERLAQQHRRAIDWIATGPVWIRGDSARLTELLLILGENALLYSPTGSRIRIVLDVQGEQALLWVYNPGPRLSERDLPHVFERFYRGENADNTEGTGLGLAIADQIVGLHQGEIRLRSPEAGGVEVCVTLPLGRSR